VRPQALAQARVEEAAFDASRLVDFAERVAHEGPATQLTPLVRATGSTAA
jgi:hypothetical protein